MTQSADRLAPVLDWLHREGRLMPNMGRFVDQLMLRSVAAGMPIWRFYVGLQIVHPQMLATGFLWRRGYNPRLAQPLRADCRRWFRQDRAAGLLA